MARKPSKKKTASAPTPLASWLAAAAKAHPQLTALEAPQGVFTYAQLHAAVRALAGKLSTAGIGEGDRVAIAATRSADTIIAILAAVESGAGYVPLDTGYPAERLQAMLEGSQPRVVLGEPDALARLRAVVPEFPTLDAPGPRGKAPFAATENLAYVLFTSGSTGKPKGVAMGTRPLAHLIDWHARHERLGQRARTLQFAPLSFDVHFQEIFSTLACAGTLVVIAEDQRRDPARLHAALIDKRVERIFLPYVALQMIADASRDVVPTTLREAVSAGEQLQITPAIRELFRRLPDAELHNHYGPTESHVVTAHELRGDASAWPEIPPIGLPLPHVTLAVRNEEDGAGELLLGGETLADGYIGRADLTAERFREDLEGLPGRWYVTGDLVRRDADGVCTYLGRADQQVKVDGFRIEPGEIEIAIMADQAVKDAVVAAPEIPGAGKQLVAYLVAREGAVADEKLFTRLRAELRGKLPEYMVPVRWVPLEKLPTTPSGKIDRKALPVPQAAKIEKTADTIEIVRAVWQDLLGLSRVGDDQNLFDLGAKSLLVLRFVARLQDVGMSGVTVADVYDRPTVRGIAAGSGKQTATRRARRADGATRGIAIVGMAARVPGAANVEEFWSNLVAGREGIRHFKPEELDASVPESIRSRSNFVAARGVIADADRFDATFFGISHREAVLLDPQQRLLLELSWNALEHAAIDSDHANGTIGAYLGTANNSYAPALRAEAPELIQQAGEFATMLASEKDYAATRVANRLDLKGPAVSVHTACSTGLVAVTQAWHALAGGQCDVAIAGGATVVVPQNGGYLHIEGAMESADGHCRPFDADASGTVFASGGAVVVLKRLEDAERDGDNIYAVIRGVGINNDGIDKASFTAPSVSGQADAIRMALDHAGVSARDIGYVEAHGTATTLGDPIEIAALTRAWRADTADNQYCGIGSLKSNLGHMIAAAGVAGLIKATLALHRELVPATLHFRKPNPQIDFTRTPFTVVDRNVEWKRGDKPRYAAVSSFGVGGTNAHVVLEEAPVAASAVISDARRMLLPLSARSAEATLQRARELADHLQAHREVSLEDVATTLMRGRRALTHRLSVVASNVDEAIAALRGAKTATAALTRPRVVFLFPGQGSQHPGMVRKLYDEAPAFREAFDRCMAIANPALGMDLGAWLRDADPSDAQVAQSLAETRHAQPALFSVSYALAAWLDSLGVRPDAMIGHSIGEYAAACHAGVFPLADALGAVIARGQAMFDQPRGSMLAVRTGVDAVRALLPAGVEIAGVNAPSLTVVAGSHEAIDAFAKQLESNDIGTTRLRVSHAFHSASMEGALPRVAQALQRAALKAPNAVVYSCISGAPLQAAEATDPNYWARQVRAPVQFSRAVSAELALGDAVFIEVGPGQALTALLRQHRTAQNAVPRNVPLLGAANDPGDPAQQALAALGAMWCAGVDVAWPVASSARRVTLPTYPFNGERHWFPRRAAAAPALAAPASNSTAVQTSENVVIMSRIPNVETELKRVLADVSGLPAEEMTSDATFVDQGLDSLSLTQAVLELDRVFGVKLRFRRLMEDLDSIAKLATFLDGEMPAGKFAPAPVAAPVAQSVAAPAATASQPMMMQPAQTLTQPVAFAPSAMPAGSSAVHQLIQQQMQLMSQQLAVLAGQPMVAAMPVAAIPSAIPSAIAAQPAATPAPAATSSSAPATEALAQPTIKSLVEKPFGASPRLTLEAKQEFTPAQRRWIDDFIAKYNAKSGKSKAFSQKYRKVMADPRVVTGFNPLWKDLVYPIVVDRSKGASLWDLDGNEYIDLLSCFGGNLLGYQPEDVISAMRTQLELGLEVGPQHPMAAEVAELITSFTGMERVGFCNTGSEAVMGAMRIARTVTGRKTIAIFTNSYHGIFDEVIVRGTKQLRSLSAAPGILANMVDHILVLDWNSEDSLRILRERGHELAAIMTEPIQNKYPTIQPREFVHSLRQIADQAGCALIFDEVVTGFRVAPGGAQEFYGVRADIATYGKVIGGGLPFAAIAGNSKWLDALDGGHWQYGDDSYPEAGVTYFAGTFVRHPLALAAARASLLHLKRGGREFYTTLNDRTQRMIERLNRAFAVRGAPVKAVHCASLWRLQWDDNQKYVSLFYYLVRYHGLHLYEQFGHFVTEGMTDAHLDRIFEVFTNALDELMALGLITPKEGGPGPQGPGGGNEKKTTPTRTEAQLSPGQTERWLAGAFDANARRALNESFCVGLQGNVNRNALKAALQDVLQRHEAFRIRFDQESPRQLLQPAAPVAVTEVDLTSRPDADQALDEFCTQASLRDFTFDQAPLAAVSLLTLADGRIVVHVVASHLVFDGWASSVFNAELATAYKARSLGVAPDFKPAESPLDFAEEEQARFEGKDGQESLKFWQQQLQNPPAPLSLGDRKPPQPRGYTADTLRVRLEGDSFVRLRTYARQSGATLFQLLLTAVTVMLRKRSGQDDFVVSIPYASQGLQRRGPLLADGVLDLPIRLGCAANEDSAAVLQRVRTRLMDALEYPLTTQGTVARSLGIRSTGDRPPLTGIYFNLNPKVDLSSYAPLTATIHEGRKRGTLSELFFNFYEQDEALTLDLHYSSEYFSPTRAQELIDALMAECAAFAGMPATSMAKAVPAPVVKPAALVAAAAQPDPRLVAWNAATAIPQEPHARVEQWISRQAKATPNDVAIVAKGTTLTYAALESRANRFANLLKSRGIGAGMLVGVCLTRGPDLVPALLGILKTGAAYVPLDPSFPKDRLQYMAEDAGVRLVITEAPTAPLSGVGRELQIRIDDDAAAIAAASDAAPAREAGWADDAPMYVIYTSGSTGKPKGVVLPQNAVCNFLASMQREPGLNASDRLLAVTTLSFDIAVLELYLPLTLGARVVIAQREEAMDGEVLAKLAADQGINVMQATPTTWHMLLDANWRAPAGFRALCGGEPLPPSLAERMLDAGVELWNMYGPTETTVWSTCCRITDAKQKITIGHPIGNTSVWVLDEQGKSCPIGQEGELCIGGAGVATGYFKRPELTAEKFIADPFDRTPGARIYRTGDLARWREDGSIEHLGRLDFQVKIRGYRIELGEIEARLAALPGVARTVVVAREDSPGDVRLVAYFVAQAGATPDVAQLRDSLRVGLPDYMLPQFIVPLDTMPLLPNGKIDRKSLPAPSGPVLSSARTVTAPRNDLERSVVKAMQSVLKVADLGVEDDFFSMGGHSLLAARLIGTLNKELGLQLSLRVLFESPTVEKLARAIDQARGGPAPVQRAPIVHQPSLRSAPLTMMQERIRFVEEMYPNRVVYHAPSAHRLKGAMNLQAFDQAFRAMMQRQPSLRTRIAATPDGFVQQIDDTIHHSLLPLEDLSALPEDRRETLLAQRIEELVAETFDLSKGPLFRSRLFKMGQDHHVLFFMPHHIVWDGWSFDIMYAEISALYEAALSGREAELPPMPVNYGDYARWHNDWIKSEEIGAQVKYWKQQYALGSMPRDPFVDLQRQAGASGEGANAYLHIETAQAERVRDLAKQTGSTLSIVALSVYAAMMSQWLDDPRPTIGMPVRGRPSAELEGVMGFFNNMLPMRLPVDTKLSGLDWIKAVRQMLVQAYANQDVPFELLAKELELSRAGAPTRLYQVMFSFQDARQRQTHWGPLAHSRVNAFQKGSTEDINLWMVEIPSGIEGGVQYNAELILPETAAALRDRFLTILGEMASNPNRSMAQLLAIKPAEQSLIDRWNGDRVEGGEPADMLDVLERRWVATPERAAVRDGSNRVDYAELGRRVQAFEAVLRPNLGHASATVAVGVADPVAHIVATLAALRAGARIIPVDPQLDDATLQAILKANAVTAVVCASAPAGVAKWIDASQIPGVRSAAAVVRHAHGVDASQAAQVALTRADLNLMLARLTAKARVQPSDRVLCVDGPARGLQFMQAMLAFAEGSELVIVPAADAQNLSTLLRDEKAGLLHASGGTWKKLLAARNGEPLPLIALLDVTDATTDLCGALIEANATVVALHRPIVFAVPVAAGILADARDSSLIGQPLLVNGVKVLDAQGSAVPPGIPGELHVDGAGGRVATGLLARWRQDGVLQHVGQIGNTAFIDGCRIDIAVLEHALKSVPGVADAGVAVLDDAVAHRRLAACVQASGSAELAACGDLMSQVLPRGVTPAISAVDRILRLADGTLDTKVFAARRETSVSRSGPSMATPTQQALAEVWQELLGVSPGPQDNFFDLGGTSLMAMNAVSKLEQRIGKQISPRRYVTESLAQIAAAYDNAGTATEQTAATKVEPAASGGFMKRLAKLIRRA